MSSPGRNDPCSCGSGQKYKRCCGVVHAQAPVVVTDDDRERAYAVLERLTRDRRFATQVDAAVGLLTEDDDWSADLAEGPVAHWFVDWLSFDVPLDRSGRTAADHARAKHAGDLTPGARLFIDTMRAAPLRLLHVQTIYFGTVLLCRDLLDPPARYRVRDDGGFERYEVIAGRLVNGPISGLFTFAEQPALILTDNRRRLVRHLLRVRRRSLETGATPPLVRMVEGAALLRVMADSESGFDEQLKTADGDPVVPTVVTFRLDDSDAFAEALAAAEDFSTDRDESGALIFDWIQREADGRRGDALAHGGVRGDAVEVTTMSPQRAERLRARLSAIAGASLSLVSIDSLDSPGERDDEGPHE